MATFTFSPSAAVSPLAAGSALIPSPWRQEPSATDSTTYIADQSNKVVGDTLEQTIKDGWRWIQLGNLGVTYTYARTEVNITGSRIPAGRISTIEWTGYYTTGLPSGTSGELCVMPGQIHDVTNGPPHYLLVCNTSNHRSLLQINNLDGSQQQQVDLMDWNNMVNNSTNIKMHYKPCSSSGVEDGSITVEINGRYIFSEAGKENSHQPGDDYSKFGMYDYTNAICSPGSPGGPRTLTQVTELYQVINR